jgi:hypothetical protein
MAPELFEPTALAALSEPLAVRLRATRCTRPLTRHGSQTYNSGAIRLASCRSQFPDYGRIREVVSDADLRITLSEAVR